MQSATAIVRPPPVKKESRALQVLEFRMSTKSSSRPARDEDLAFREAFATAFARPALVLGKREPDLPQRVASRGEVYQAIFEYMESLSSLHNGRRRRLCENFFQLPPKKTLPEYYSIISYPIDMATIKSRIARNAYADDTVFVADFVMLFKNAQIYNPEDTQVYDDAAVMLQVLCGIFVCMCVCWFVGFVCWLLDVSWLQIVWLFYIFIIFKKCLWYCIFSLISILFSLTHTHKHTHTHTHSLTLSLSLSLTHSLTLSLSHSLLLLFTTQEFYSKARELLPREVLMACPALRGAHSRLEALTDLLLSMLLREIDGLSGRILADSFLYLPDRSRTEYYDVITDPICFNSIRERIESGFYYRLDQFQDDVFSIFRNVREVYSPEKQVCVRV